MKAIRRADIPGPSPLRAGLLACLLAVHACVAPASAAEAQPRRVVSMNLCTDQMAMLVADPGQLLSVSYLASDPAASVLSAQAGRYAVNHGLAEEIFLMKPALVLAGQYTTRATVELLRRLGIHVEEFAPENSFDDIRANLLRMGELLGRREQARALAAELDRRLADLPREGQPGMTVAAYYANNYTSGSGTLMDAIMTAAGLTNVAAKRGYVGTAQLPLEVLVLSDPDLLLTGGDSYSAPALAQEGFEHPAFRSQARLSTPVEIPSRYTICGAPFTAEAVRLLAEAAAYRRKGTE